MNTEQQMTESEVRALRDRIYGASTDANWNGCKENWLRPESIRWLITTASNLQPATLTL